MSYRDSIKLELRTVLEEVLLAYFDVKH